MTPAIVDLLPLSALNAVLRGAKIERVLLGMTAGGTRFVIATDQVDADTGQKIYLVVEDAQRVELLQGVLTVMGGEDDGRRS